MENIERELFVEAIELVLRTMRNHMGDTANSIMLFDDGSGAITLRNRRFEDVNLLPFDDAEELYKEITDGK